MFIWAWTKMSDKGGVVFYYNALYCLWISTQYFVSLWGDWSEFVYFFLGNKNQSMHLWCHRWPVGDHGLGRCPFRLVTHIFPKGSGSRHGGMLVWWLMRPIVLFLVVGMHLNCFIFLQIFNKCSFWHKRFWISHFTACTELFGNLKRSLFCVLSKVYLFFWLSILNKLI